MPFLVFPAQQNVEARFDFFHVSASTLIFFFRYYIVHDFCNLHLSLCLSFSANLVTEYAADNYFQKEEKKREIILAFGYSILWFAFFMQSNTFSVNLLSENEVGLTLILQ